MNRRRFITTAIGATGATILPTILPARTLWAPTGTRLAKHVVFCLIAGGVRNFESLQKKEGNLMPNLLTGSESISKDILPGIELMPRVYQQALQTSGTLYKEFRYGSDETIHYSGHAAAITGTYKGDFEIMKPLKVPTIFELYRKHGNPNGSALDAWWVTDQAGPFPFLNCSNHPQYGPLYGANMIHPLSFFDLHYDSLNFFSKESLALVGKMKGILSQHTAMPEGRPLGAGIINTEEDRFKLENFIRKTSKEHFQNGSPDFWKTGAKANEDIITMFAACEVLKTFKPELLVVNMQHVDIGHANFTQMCNNLNKADFALAKLWQTIQSTPGLKDDTVLIAAPEFGRNATNNTIIDAYGRAAVDHTGDMNSRNIFCLVLGPEHVVRQNNVIREEVGETIDIVPTIAHVLGFRERIPDEFIHGKVLSNCFI